MAPLPRVAGISSGPVRQPVRSSLDTSTARARETISKDPVFSRENMPAADYSRMDYKDRMRQGSVGSVVFGGIDAPEFTVKKASTYVTSQDNPLFVPEGTMRPAGTRVRPPPAPIPLPQGMAGKPQHRSVPLGSVMVGADAPAPGQPSPYVSDRSLSQSAFPPSYRIHPSTQDTGAKDLLYPSEPAPVGSTPRDQDHSAAASAPMLHNAFESLREHFNQVPRDGEGNIDEDFARRMLEAHGFDLSIDGFAEFLARCDISGFPTFEQFIGCTLRPHRPDPSKPPSAPSSAPKAALAGEFGTHPQSRPDEPHADSTRPAAEQGNLPSGMNRSVTFESASATTPPATTPASSQPFAHQPSQHPAMASTHEKTQYAPSEHMQRSWRYMQMAESIDRSMPAIPSYAPTTSMPLGAKAGIAPLGTNVPASNAAGTYGRSASISKGHSVDRYY